MKRILRVYWVRHFLRKGTVPPRYEHTPTSTDYPEDMPVEEAKERILKSWGELDPDEMTAPLAYAVINSHVYVTIEDPEEKKRHICFERDLFAPMEVMKMNSTNPNPKPGRRIKGKR
jgi:hypothetical protein